MQLLDEVTVATDKPTYIHVPCNGLTLPTCFSATTVAVHQAGIGIQHPCPVARRSGTHKLGAWGCSAASDGYQQRLGYVYTHLLSISRDK